MYKIINSKVILKTLPFLLLVYLGISLLTSCGKHSDKKEVILATVADDQITVEDFRRNYEFGLPHLKQEPDRKLSYLNYMIYERVLSLEGYKLGFDNSPRVKKYEKELLDELLIEELFKKNVNSKIEVKPEEVREAILKSQVSWKMSYWFEKDKEQADFIRNEMSKNGFTNTINEILKINPEIHLKAKDFETGYITWLEIEPEILEKIKDLSINEISEPIHLDNGYYIFQIKDIRREPISDFTIKNKYESFKQVLYYRKLKEEAGRYITSVMEPKNVVTKGKALYELTKAFLTWRQDTLNYKFADFLYENNKDLLNKTLVTFDQKSWTVSDFVKKFDPYRIKNKSKNIEKIGGEISKQIALEVRDNTLIKLAKDDNLEESETLKKQLKEWRDKWVYEETRRHFLDQVKISDEEAKKFFEQNINLFQINANEVPKFDEFKNTAKKFAYIKEAKSILIDKIDSLKKVYPIHINYSVLDTIQTIDSKKSRWQSLQVFKRSSGRLAAPIVDPAWGL